jgi:hypothetical protein
MFGRKESNPMTNPETQTHTLGRAVMLALAALLLVTGATVVTLPEASAYGPVVPDITCWVNVGGDDLFNVGCR